MKPYDYFYCINGHFPTDDNLIILPKPKIPDFIQANKEILLTFMYEQFTGSKC